MSKEEFFKLFLESLEKAVSNAEVITNRILPRNYKILLYGANQSGLLISPEEAIDILYISENLFYKLIDLSVTKVNERYVTIFTRVSSHHPDIFEHSWNQPEGSGPFKQLICNNIEFE